MPNLVLFPVKFDILLHCATLRLESFFNMSLQAFSVSSCKRAFDEQFVFLYSAFRCAASRFSFSALSSLISWGLVQRYRLRIAIFEQAKYTRAEEGEKMLSSLRVSPSSRVAIFTRALARVTLAFLFLRKMEGPLIVYLRVMKDCVTAQKSFCTGG